MMADSDDEPLRSRLCAADPDVAALGELLHAAELRAARLRDKLGDLQQPPDGHLESADLLAEKLRETLDAYDLVVSGMRVPEPRPLLLACPCALAVVHYSKESDRPRVPWLPSLSAAKNNF